jgi:glycosyltransferase involved in cell wall biosynthesis
MVIKATFFMEQHIGHRTYYENLRQFVDAGSQIDATWVEVTYSQSDTIWARLPLLPNGLRGTLMGREQVRRGLRRSGGEIALFNTQVPAALASGLVRKRPYILSTDITPLQYDRMGAYYGHQPDKGGLLSRYKHRVNVNLFQGASRLLPWSSWTADSLVKDYGVDARRIEVVPPGVDTERWHPGETAENGPVRILFVGGDFYRKGGEILLQAFEQLPAGSAELALVTRSILDQKPGIVIHNNMKPNSAELIALFQSCHIFVLPTSAEAFGIAAIEASASGLPVIATRIGGLVDIVADGKTGFLVPEADTNALSARLKLLVEDRALRQRLGQAAHKRVEDRFNARKNADRVAEILKDSIRNDEITKPGG